MVFVYLFVSTYVRTLHIIRILVCFLSLIPIFGMRLEAVCGRFFVYVDFQTLPYCCCFLIPYGTGIEINVGIKCTGTIVRRCTYVAV